MITLEFKVKAKPIQYDAIDEAIRTTQLIRNKCLRFWMDNEKVSKYKSTSTARYWRRSLVRINSIQWLDSQALRGHGRQSQDSLTTAKKED